MKKWFLVIAVVFIAAFASIYIFIPGQLNIVQITSINCTANGAYRVLSNAGKWQAWWPGVQSNSNTFHYKDGSFSITKELRNTLEILIQQNELMPRSVLHVFPATGDSSTLHWQCSIATGINPFKRIQHYRQAVALKSNMDAVLSRFKTFAEKKENIYGISFEIIVFRDSLLISTKSIQKDYPNVSTVYTQINALKKYSASHRAKQTAPPLMNLTPLNPAGYQLLTALPVDREVPASGKFFNQNIPLNRFWVIRVHGGASSVDEAIHQFQLYVQDYQRVVMALPFQKLITDRSTEPDTSRWVTDIYFPLF
ncbi:hypothetical protein [Niastella sp. OAS944]|uniref:hypothetical protein n=1 Tax=Niastella sp. OAS944 TaxID=2664089 RepID=UPI0034769D5D|nr:hypothetical protein [Chitinophagaceae bacterium OAS944]